MKFNHLSQNDYGETRIKRFFAFLPVRIGSETRWLEMVTVKESVVKSLDTTNYRYSYYWQRQGFIDR